MISVFKSVKSHAEQLTWLNLNAMLDNQRIVDIIKAVRACDNKDERGKLKKQLPGITWQSYFKEGCNRWNKTAQPSGFFMLDIDNVEKPLELWNSVKEKLELKKLLIAHVTPSGKGLRLVYENFPASTIEENQEILAKMLDVEYDIACKDFARLSYACSRGDVLYLNATLFEEGPKQVYIRNEENQVSEFASNDSASLFDNQGNATPSAAVPASDNDSNNSSLQPSLIYKGDITYERIINELIAAMGGEPHEGYRNTFLYRLARKVRYIVDFNPFKLYQVVPSFGLPKNEVESVCQSACKSARSEKIPYDLYMILKRFETNDEDYEEEEQVDDKTDVPLPPLPPIFKQFVRIAPDDFKVPTIFALLPVIGTLASRLRAVYLDGEKHAPNFTTVIEAPQASGKSFARRIVKTCMEQIEYMDGISRIAEQQYLMQLKRAKNSNKQPEEPTAIIRIIPASVSIAKLLKRLNNSKGLHLFSFLEELDTLTKSNKAGAWSQKTDIYRNAFDNADYGQEYMSENSFSGIFPVFYNLLLCGTPAAVKRFYYDPEDGLISRIIFCKLPSQFGAKMPVFKKLTSFEMRMIQNKCSALNDNLCCTPEQDVVAEHYEDLAFLNKAIDRWNEHQRLESIREVSSARNVFYRRSAVMGFRAGMLAYYLYGEKTDRDTKKNVIRFALFVANYILNSLLEKFSQSLEKSISGKEKEYQVDLFKQMPDKFSRNELIAMAKKFNVATPVKVIVSNWKKYNYITEVQRFEYKKSYDRN